MPSKIKITANGFNILLILSTTVFSIQRNLLFLRHAKKDKGKTIGKAPDGRVIFLTNTVPGDVVDVQTTKKRKAYFEGKAIKFHSFSDKRVDPVCQHFGVCGGCKWQDMGYEHQLFYKQKEVENNLRRIGHLDLPELTPILGSKEQYFYRNKMEFSFSDSRLILEINMVCYAP